MGKRERRRPFTGLIDGRIILKCIFERLDVGPLTGSIWLRIGIGGGLL
jgi:hypothetical protein